MGERRPERRPDSDAWAASQRRISAPPPPGSFRRVRPTDRLAVRNGAVPVLVFMSATRARMGRAGCASADRRRLRMGSYDDRYGGDRWRDRDQGSWNRDRDYGRGDY